MRYAAARTAAIGSPESAEAALAAERMMVPASLERLPCINAWLSNTIVDALLSAAKALRSTLVPVLPVTVESAAAPPCKISVSMKFARANAVAAF